MEYVDYNMAEDYIWAASLMDELADMGLPRRLPTVVFEGVAAWLDSDLGQARPNLEPTMVKVVLAAETLDGSRVFAAYQIDEDRRNVVVEWRFGDTNEAEVRLVDWEDVGDAFITAVTDWPGDLGFRPLRPM